MEAFMAAHPVLGLILILAVGMIGLFIEVWLITNCIMMIKDRNFHAFPSITRCVVCKKRVFIWQRRGRKRFPVPVVGYNPGGLVKAWMDTNIHRGCCDAPAEIEPIRRYLVSM
jgi:hypothetical protein